MRVMIIISLVFLSSCFNETDDNLVDKLDLFDIGKQLNGYWILTKTIKDGQSEHNSNTDELEHFEFDGIKGIRSYLTDNHDGTFSISSFISICRLKDHDDKKFLEFTSMFDNWELEIVKITKGELILADSTKTWIYKSFQKE